MSTMSVLISVGAVLGKTNLVQLVFMTLMEVTVFGTMRMLFRKFFFVSCGVVRRWKGRVSPPFGEASGVLKNEDRPKWGYHV